MLPSQPLIVVLTGEIEAGKTTSCLAIARLAASRGWDVAGVVSPAIFHQGNKVGIAVRDLRSGRSRPLAFRCSNPEPGNCSYLFDESGLAWADAQVAASGPCDLLVLDELGLLEIEQGRGVTSAFRVLRDGRYRMAIVVVRPWLVDAFIARLGFPCAVRAVERATVPPAIGPPDVSVAWFEEYLHGQ